MQITRPFQKNFHFGIGEHFRWRAIRLFNSLPKSIRDTTNCSVCSFKQRLDRYLNSIPDLPCTPGYNNSLDGGDCLQRWTLRDDLVAS